MDDTRLLIGSLSNDLYRVANLMHEGSNINAERFLQEASRWIKKLEKKQVKNYIRKILTELNTMPGEFSDELAEKYLMYSVLLQNYSLHIKKMKGDYK